MKTTYQAINALGAGLRLAPSTHIIFTGRGFLVAGVGHLATHRVCTGPEYNELVEELSHGTDATQFGLYCIHDKPLLSKENSGTNAMSRLHRVDIDICFDAPSPRTYSTMASTEHEQHMCEMLLRMMRGQPVEVKLRNGGSFKKTFNGLLNTTHEYRVPVKKLVIPWEHIKPEYKYAKVNGAGQVFVSKNPFLNDWCIGESYEIVEVGMLMHIDVEGIEPMTTCERPA